MEDRPMTYDESSMERSKSFVQGLQVLKNLRPQLYSAAKYCDKSYLHSEQKQMVLDNVKDYTVQALVNAVDHLGTLAYKLTNLHEQQSLDITVMELQVMSLDQQLLTCQTFADKEGLRQQQLLVIISQHHKHYILPNIDESTRKKPVVSLIQVGSGLPTYATATLSVDAARRDGCHVSVQMCCKFLRIRGLLGKPSSRRRRSIS